MQKLISCRVPTEQTHRGEIHEPDSVVINFELNLTQLGNPERELSEIPFFP